MILISALISLFLVCPIIPLRKNKTSNTLGIRAYCSGYQMEGDPKVIIVMYDDTSEILERDGEKLKWEEVYHMFKKSKFFIEAKG